MAARTARAVETRKKKSRRAIPRAKVTRVQGNTAGARKRLKKVAAKAQEAKAKAAAPAS
jgi:hypothetical protein